MNKVTITIPKTIAQAKQVLHGVDQLLLAKEWERAAIVYAFTEPGSGGRRTASSSSQLSIRAFTEQGITGLRFHGTVRAYRMAWEKAIAEYGAKPVKPGDVVSLPTDLFPDNPLSAKGTMSSFKAAIAKNPKVLAETFKADPKALTDAIYYGGEEVENVVADAIAGDAYVAEKVMDKVAERRKSTATKPIPKVDWDKLLGATLSEHARADRFMREFVQDLPADAVYPRQIQEVIDHLESDRSTSIPGWLVTLRDLLVTARGAAAPVQPDERIEKDVSPVKELV